MRTKSLRAARFLAVLLFLPLLVTASAHPGRTDSDGGHYDRGTGEYHWHHGYGAHQHEDLDGDGILDCPYEFDDKTGSGSSGSSGYSSSYKSPYNTYETEPPTEIVTEPPTQGKHEQKPSEAEPSEKEPEAETEETEAENSEKLVLLSETEDAQNPIDNESKSKKAYYPGLLDGLLCGGLLAIAVDVRRRKQIKAANGILSAERASQKMKNEWFQSKIDQEQSEFQKELKEKDLVQSQLRNTLWKKDQELEEIKAGLRKPHLREMESLQERIESLHAKLEEKNAEIESLQSQVKKTRAALEKLRKSVEEPDALTRNERFLRQHDPLGKQNIQIPLGVRIYERPVAVKGSVGKDRPFGDYTVFIAPAGRTFHARCGCGAAFKPANLFDAMETRSPCTKCVPYGLFPRYEPYWYTQLKCITSSYTEPSK